MNLRSGDWVVVKSKEEILNSLDSRGQMEGLPFMPQMFQYCGQRFRVYKKAHKTCDTVNQTGGRRLAGCVHLELRCDGEAYGGCQAACLIFWKDTWLRPTNETGRTLDQSLRNEPLQINRSAKTARCSEKAVWAGTRTQDQQVADEPRYICQATQLPFFTTPLSWWDIRQYIEDYISGNVSLGQLLRGLVYATHNRVSWSSLGLGRPFLSRPLCWLYDKVQALWGGLPYPRRSGTIPADQSTPSRALNLQPGELVRVRSYEEILATLNVENKNRGLCFDAEMVPYCGGVYRVKTRLNKCIDEKTGRLLLFKNASLILENIWCQARYSDCRMLCPRSIYSWWREIWLERFSE